METPPELPTPKPPLGTRFYVLLITPLALMAICFCCIKSNAIAGPLITLASLATLVCSILLARLTARRMNPDGRATAGRSILLFCAFQAFYGVCFFAGCTAAIVLS